MSFELGQMKGHFHRFVESHRTAFPECTSRSASRDADPGLLFLGPEAAVIVPDELLNLGSLGQELQPLLFIEGYGETPQAIHRKARPFHSLSD
jgi:hypothetical protein